MLRGTLLALLFTCCLARLASAQVTTEGTEFWLGFMENVDGQAASSLEIFLTSKQQANVNIFIYNGNTSRDIVVMPQQTVREVIHLGTENPFAARGSEQIERKAIRVTSDVPISVYAFNNRDRSGDAAVILPITALGKSYRATTYHEIPPPGDNFTQNSDQAELIIVATANDTNIDITPSTTTLQGRPEGETFSITLNRGDVYQVQANGDLTGTLIESASQNEEDCKNFAVFGGNKWTRVTAGNDCSVPGRPGGFAGDHLYEQMYPINTWGREYTALPFQLRTGYVLRTMAAEDGTTVNIDGQVRTLNAGEYETTTHMAVARVESDKPIQVAQFSESLSCDFQTTTGPGDPFMLMLSPNEQQLREITFNALNAAQIEFYYVALITPTLATGELFLNGVQVESNFFFEQVPGNPDLSHVTVAIQQAEDVTVTSDTGFIAYVYGFGNIESFGYVAGASLENLNLEVVGDDETIGIIVEEGCVNSLVNFSVDFEVTPGQPPRFTQFNWDFGDGTVVDGQNVTHTYTEAGEYQINLIASDGGGACGNRETISRTITITDTNVQEVTGPLSVCPDVTDITYVATGPVDNTYEWFIEGGTITNQNNDVITVDWGAARNDAFIKVLPTNYLGCKGDTITLDVTINKRLEPALPQGPAEVCLADIANVQYATPPTNGSEYEWFITGGTIVSGANTNAVTVNWDGVGNGQLWYREFNPDISDCEGFSDRYDVVVYDDVVVVATPTPVSCNGGSDGRIDLAISGGKPGDYTVDWSNGDNGPNLGGLTAGSYEGTVRDEIGCVAVVNVTITEPDALVISNSSIQDVRCFEESNGVLSVAVNGGTPDANGRYRFAWSGPGVSELTDVPELSGLPTGNYNLTVTDDNGCTVEMSFFIDEPPLLEPDLETLVNQPICPDATDGTAFIEAKGGTPDYQFFWSNNPTVDQQLGENFAQGTYTVRIVDANGCETSLDVEVTERFPRIYLPNAFSPNGDGENDEFKAVTDCNLIFNMQVYNEWGAVIFASSDIFTGWDGTVDGQPAPNGKYSYIVFYSGTLNGVAFEETLRGTLRLLR